MFDMLKKTQVVVYSMMICGFIAVAILFNRRRMSHDNGVTCRGKLKIVDNPTFPPLDLFEPGKVFGCRLRHGPASTDDDAKLLVRGASVKFADVDGKAPFGLLMNTGPCPLFNNIRSFIEFGKIFGGSAGPAGTQCQEFRGVRWIPYMQKHAGSLDHWITSMRRNPSSYSRLYYYSKMPQHYRSGDGTTRYAKFRMIPGDRGPESGLLEGEDLRSPWYYNRLPGETRSRNYLKDEFEERVEREGVQYLIQVQVHEWEDGDSEELFDSYTIWDETTHPWHDLATVEVDEVLSYEQDRLTIFSIAHRPKSLDIISPKSIDDPNSLNYLRVWAMWPRQARLFGQKLFGYAKPPEDTFWGWPGKETEEKAREYEAKKAG